MEELKQEKAIGAMWIKTGKNGEFLSGNIEIANADGTNSKKNFVAFKNRKSADNQPDWKILPTLKKDQPQDNQYYR